MEPFSIISGSEDIAGRLIRRLYYADTIYPYKQASRRRQLRRLLPLFTGIQRKISSLIETLLERPHLRDGWNLRLQVTSSPRESSLGSRGIRTVREGRIR